MPKVAGKSKRPVKVKIKVSLDDSVVEWIDSIVSARNRGGKDGRSTVINQGLRWLKRHSHKHLVTR